MRLPLVPLTALVTVACVGCTTRPPDPRLAYCTQLHSHYYRYRPLPRANHDGQIAKAEYAVYECRQGRYDESIATLTGLIQRHRVAVPPPPKRPVPRPVDDDPEPYE